MNRRVLLGGVIADDIACDIWQLLYAVDSWREIHPFEFHLNIRLLDRCRFRVQEGTGRRLVLQPAVSNLLGRAKDQCHAGLFVLLIDWKSCVLL